MKKKERLIEAMSWFKEHDIECFLDDENLYVHVGLVSVQVSRAEIKYRSTLKQIDR